MRNIPVIAWTFNQSLCSKLHPSGDQRGNTITINVGLRLIRVRLYWERFRQHAVSVSAWTRSRAAFKCPKSARRWWISAAFARTGLAQSSPWDNLTDKSDSKRLSQRHFRTVRPGMWHYQSSTPISRLPKFWLTCLLDFVGSCNLGGITAFAVFHFESIKKIQENAV